MPLHNRIYFQISATFRANQKAGLGSSLAGEQSLDNVTSASKVQRKLQAQQRFQMEFTKKQETGKGKQSPGWVKGETQHTELDENL